MSRLPHLSRNTSSKRRRLRSAGRRRMLVETLECRRLLAADDGGAGTDDPAPYLFQIEESGEPNQIRIVVEEESLQVWDEVAQSLLDQIPLECVSEITVAGSLDPDELIVDFQGGDFTVPINYDGSDPTTGSGDSLTLINGETESVTHQLQDFASGEIIAAGTTLNQSISYTGLEPINDALVAANRLFIFLGGAESIQFSDDAIANNDDFNLIDSTASESIRFRNPTNSLLIDSADVIVICTVGEWDLMSSFPSMTIDAG